MNKAIDAGRVKGPFVKDNPLHVFVYSILGLVPKKEPTSYRLIHDVSYPKGHSVNSGISTECLAVQYQNIETFQYNVLICLMSKKDLEHAFA